MPCFKKNILFLAVIYSTAIILVYSLYVLHRSIRFYSYIKSDHGLVGNVYSEDPELGFVPIPGSKGMHLFKDGPSIQTRYDDEGFRVPLDSNDTTSRSRPLVLALGCSYTYGDRCHAEKTFPYLVGKLIGGSSLNAGVCSYGLSQMLILARRLIPRYKPDYVLVQYSPWLITRAQAGLSPTAYGKMPTSFFINSNGAVKIHPPLFSTKILDLPLSEYRDTEKGIRDYLSFQLFAALPLYIHDDFNMLIRFIKKQLGIIPSPPADRSVVKAVYEEIMKIAQDNGARVVVVILNNDSNPVPHTDVIAAHITVDAHAALLKRHRIATDKGYRRHYAHWSGSPPRCVDIHPNEYAHSIIAEEIAKAIHSDR